MQWIITLALDMRLHYHISFIAFYKLRQSRISQQRLYPLASISSKLKCAAWKETHSQGVINMVRSFKQWLLLMSTVNQSSYHSFYQLYLHALSPETCCHSFSESPYSIVNWRRLSVDHLKWNSNHVELKPGCISGQDVASFTLLLFKEFNCILWLNKISLAGWMWCVGKKKKVRV